MNNSSTTHRLRRSNVSRHFALVALRSEAMNARRLLACALDPSRLLLQRGLVPDDWQREVLLCSDRQVLLCCSRQSGKSTTVSALAYHTAVFRPEALVLLLSPSLRQSREIYRKVLQLDDALGRPLPSVHRSQLLLELANGPRVICLPGREDTVRSFGGVNLLVLDEAARVPEQLYRAVRPMLAVSHGRLVALSTPFGRRGWFYQEWVGSGPWRRFHVPWQQCPRIAAEFIAEERRALGQLWVAQEYDASFTTLQGLVYPDFERCLSEGPTPSGRRVGGIDFGWRNPFAAVWGVLDKQDCLWIVGERYASQTALQEHAQALRALGAIHWFADPAGATEIAALQAAGLKVQPANNALRAGIAAVSGRLQSGRLRVRRGACPELLREAGLYRYPDADEQTRLGENPLDAHNHALAALRYLVAGIDARHLARRRERLTDEAPSETALDLPNPERLWTFVT
jgi:hypothetical protein